MGLPMVEDGGRAEEVYKVCMLRTIKTRIALQQQTVKELNMFGTCTFLEATTVFVSVIERSDRHGARSIDCWH